MEELNQPTFLPAKQFRQLLILTAFTAFTLIVVGILVRVTISGAACPDWPTCLGRWTPPTGEQAMIAYFHRALASLTGLLVSMSIYFTWRKFRQERTIKWSLAIAFLLLVIQSGMGWMMVERETSGLISAVHLALALAVLGSLLAAVLAASHLWSIEQGVPHFQFRSPFARLALVTLVVTTALMMSGTLVTALTQPALCSGWLACEGRILPGDLSEWIHLIHRFFAGAAGILIAWLVVKAWLTQRSQTAILVSTTASGTLITAQILMGAVEIAQGYPIYLSGLHASTAIAAWAGLLITAILAGLAGRTLEEETSESRGYAIRISMGKDFLMLTKPVVVSLLLVTTFAGMVVGGQAWPTINILFWTMLGGAMAAGGSSAINQYIDRYDDMKMQRTAHRPIPAGRLTPAEGLAFGVGLCIISFFVMVVFVNFLAAMLSLAGIFYYVVIYSLILKKATVQNIVIGGGAGAIPPLVGWAAATGSINIPALFLFAVIFMWTPPHFWALALVRRNDYERAGVPMLPVVRGEKETRWQIFVYTLELVALTLILPIFGLGGGVYLVSAAFLGAGLIFSAWNVWQKSGNKVAWKMYRHSSMYLALLFVALMVDALV
jgi:heme o synthase